MEIRYKPNYSCFLCRRHALPLSSTKILLFEREVIANFAPFEVMDISELVDNNLVLFRILVSSLICFCCCIFEKLVTKMQSQLSVIAFTPTEL